MQELFGRIMVSIAIKLKVPIFVVYYCIITIPCIIFGYEEVILNFAELFQNVVFLIMFGYFWVILPLVWSYKSRGAFWKTPDEEVYRNLFG